MAPENQKVTIAVLGERMGNLIKSFEEHRYTFSQYVDDQRKLARSIGIKVFFALLSGLISVGVAVAVFLLTKKDL